jgi:alpha-tubulin suppressor-like RCC1 family protein
MTKFLALLAAFFALSTHAETGGIVSSSMAVDTGKSSVLATPRQISGAAYERSSSQTSTPLISAGGYSSYGLAADGTLWAWGRDNLGQLGDSKFTNSPRPIRVSSIDPVKAIAANNHVLLLTTAGLVWEWGQNTYGQLGFGDSTVEGAPVFYSGISDVRAVAAGSSFSVALKSDGSVWSWGTNELGQFGDGSSNTPIALFPVAVSGIATATSVAAGLYHTVALLADGTVAAWGNNASGQLGAPSGDQCLQWAKKFACAKNPLKVSGLNNVLAIASGSSHVLALKADGTVWAWGLNDGGQLGNGTATDSPVPIQVSSLSNVVAIAAGGRHSLALKADGTVWSWGWNDKGQLGYPSTDTCRGPGACSKLPGQIASLADVTSISGGSVHSLALKADGSVWAWGMGQVWGQLGNNSILSDSINPVQVVDQSGQGQLNLGANQIAAIPLPPTKPVSNAAMAFDCLLDWAEATYPAIFAPRGTATRTLGILSYRTYSVSGSYLALTANDGHFIYMGSLAPNSLLDLGTIADWYVTAKCQ